MTAAIDSLRLRLGEKAFYFIVGVSVWIIGTCLLIFLVEGLGFHPNAGNAVELVLTFQLNYALQARFTFIKNKAESRGAYFRRALKFNLFRLAIAGGEWVLMTGLNWLGTHYLLSNFTAIVVGYIIGYLLVRKFVFR